MAHMDASRSGVLQPEGVAWTRNAYNAEHFIPDANNHPNGILSPTEIIDRRTPGLCFQKVKDDVKTAAGTTDSRGRTADERMLGKSLEEQLEETTIRAEEAEKLARRFWKVALILEKKVDYYTVKAAEGQAAAQEQYSAAKEFEKSMNFWYDTAQSALESSSREQARAQDLEQFLNATADELQQRKDEIAWGAPLLKSLQRANGDLRTELDRQRTENRKLRAKLDAELKSSAAQQFSKGVCEDGCSMALALVNSCKAVPVTLDMTAATPSGSCTVECSSHARAEADGGPSEQMEACLLSSQQLDACAPELQGPASAPSVTHNLADLSAGRLLPQSTCGDMVARAEAQPSACMVAHRVGADVGASCASSSLGLHSTAGNFADAGLATPQPLATPQLQACPPSSPSPLGEKDAAARAPTQPRFAAPPQPNACASQPEQALLQPPSQYQPQLTGLAGAAAFGVASCLAAASVTMSCMLDLGIASMNMAASRMWPSALPQLSKVIC